MCFSYAINFSPEKVKTKFGIKDVSLPTQGFFFNGFDHPDLPVITMNNEELICENMSWGLIPHWAKGEQQALELRNLSLNAKSETAFEKPMFQIAWESHPCLIVASGFFEWKHINNQRIPHYIFAPNDEIITMAGIYDIWTNTISGEVIKSYSILTTTANPFMAEIHNIKKRMPVIIHEKNRSNWLKDSPEKRVQICSPIENNYLDAFSVSTKLNNPKNNRNEAWAIQPANFANQTTLF